MVEIFILVALNSHQSFYYVVYRNTPVPSGPNSFGKSKLGFSQDYKMYERKLMEQIGDPDKPHEKKSSNPPS